MSHTPETDIYVPVNEEGVTYEFHGPDAQARHDRWALTGEETYDAVVPLSADGIARDGTNQIQTRQE